MSNTTDPLAGNVLDGRYEILSRLARGGMATVYRAWDRRLERVVAVKVMHDGLGDDADFAKKFDREARAAAKLVHPNVVSIYDQGQDQGRPYIVMEFVEGHTLRNVIMREAPVTPLRALQLMEPVAAALAAAHDAGLVHRDVKPENVLIGPNGEIKVADFGLARTVTSNSATATQGLLIGTVSYLPPELVISGKADARSDIYSAGIVLYELLTGTKPYSGDTPIQVAYAHVNQDVGLPSVEFQANHPQRARRAPIPDYIDALVVACTRRDANLRPRDGHALLSRIRRARRALERGIGDDDALVAIMHPLASPDWDKAATTMVTAGATRAAPQTPVEPVAAAIAADDAPSEPVHHASHPVPAPVPVKSAARFPELSERAVYRRRRGVVLVGVIVLLAVLLAIGSWWVTSGRFTTTPALAGLSREQATQVASDAGLSIVFTEGYSEDVPKGQVIGTQPAAAARILRNGTVNAVISRGPERYPMPDVFGKTLEQATAALTSNNLKVGNVSQAYHPSGAKGTVIETGVAAGQLVKPGTSIDLVLSKGPEPIKVPNVVNQAQAVATQAIKNAGLSVEVTTANSKDVEKGAVISQDPAPGKELIAGDSVQIKVSEGPKSVKVPDVKGMKIAEATDTLEQAGFQVEVKYATNLGSRLGLALATTPAAGSDADEGSTVSVQAV